MQQQKFDFRVLEEILTLWRGYIRLKLVSSAQKTVKFDN